MPVLLKAKFDLLVSPEYPLAPWRAPKLMIRRRDFLKSALILAGAPLSMPALLPSVAAAQPSRKLQQFDYIWLKNQARRRSCSSYQAPKVSLPKALAKLDYDDYQSIRFDRDRSLWADDGLPFRVEFFHRGPMFSEPVRMHEIVDAQAREILYHPAMFDLRRTGVDIRALSRELGFAGFRIHFHTDWRADVAAFLGASYFRAVGSDYRQYGLSARGLAIDTGLREGRGVSALHRVLARAPDQEFGRVDRLCADGFA